MQLGPILNPIPSESAAVDRLRAALVAGRLRQPQVRRGGLLSRARAGTHVECRLHFETHGFTRNGFTVNGFTRNGFTVKAKRV